MTDVLQIWNGEFGPVYASPNEEDHDRINSQRYNLLGKQLSIYKADQIHWSIWLYKDIGFQGMVYVSPKTLYMQRLKPFLEKKYRLAVDSWGADDAGVQHVFRPIVDLIKEAIPREQDRRLYPWPNWSVEERVSRLARATLIGEFLVKEWAEYFREMDETQLEEMAKSFHLDNCMKREGLNRVLREHARQDT